MSTQDLWIAKLAAWTPDPDEKALELMRDPAYQLALERLPS